MFNFGPSSGLLLSVFEFWSKLYSQSPSIDKIPFWCRRVTRFRQYKNEKAWESGSCAIQYVKIRGDKVPSASIIVQYDNFTSIARMWTNFGKLSKERQTLPIFRQARTTVWEHQHPLMLVETTINPERQNLKGTIPSEACSLVCSHRWWTKWAACIRKNAIFTFGCRDSSAFSTWTSIAETTRQCGGRTTWQQTNYCVELSITREARKEHDSIIRREGSISSKREQHRYKNCELGHTYHTQLKLDRQSRQLLEPFIGKFVDKPSLDSLIVWKFKQKTAYYQIST